MPGIDKAKLYALPVIKDRLTFLYLEHCTLSRSDGSITVTDARGTVYVPAAMIGVLFLGPGTRVTHRAIELISNTGTSIIWVGEQGVRYYAHGRSLTHSSKLLTQQAKLVSDPKLRLEVARTMYQKRFPREDFSDLTMQQLRGREGARVRAVYKLMSNLYNVPWEKREYNPNEFDTGTPINQALSVAHFCLYGLVQSVIVSLGCSPGLGFIHTGHENSFVYDIADLYKANVSVPTAFEVIAGSSKNIEADTRKKMRDYFAKEKIIELIVADICELLKSRNDLGFELAADILHLWDEEKGVVAHGFSYGKEAYDEETPSVTGYGKFLEEKK